MAGPEDSSPRLHTPAQIFDVIREKCLDCPPRSRDAPPSRAPSAAAWSIQSAMVWAISLVLM
jgi:hypothetical protein